MLHKPSHATPAVEIRMLPISKQKNCKYFQKNQYSLTHNFFDPSRSSPPNHFISILQERLEKMEVSLNKE